MIAYAEAGRVRWSRDRSGDNVRYLGGDWNFVSTRSAR